MGMKGKNENNGTNYIQKWGKQHIEAPNKHKNNDNNWREKRAKSRILRKLINK